MDENIIQLIAAFFGSAGFALIFNIRYSHVFLASLGGCLGWAIFLFVDTYTTNYFIPCFIASAFIALYGEIMARTNKTPATVFFIPGVVPLIPGASLYHTASYALKSDWTMFKEHGSLTLQYALGIACGLSIAWALWYMCQRIYLEVLTKRSS